MKSTIENPSRRRLFKGKLATQAPALRLPWIKSEQHFIDNCTQCNDCINACETNIITLDDANFPKIDFSQDECTFCGKCQETCQQPLFIDKAIVEQEQIKPWPTDLAINEKCLAKNQIFCQSCQDVCDEKAITFSYLTSSIPEPVVQLSDCSQCGACVSVCPQQAIELKLSTNTNEVAHV